jgi:hypothetical protein
MLVCYTSHIKTRPKQPIAIDFLQILGSGLYYERQLL